MNYYGELRITYDIVVVLLCIIILTFVLVLLILCKNTTIKAEDNESIPLARIPASVYSLMEIHAATDGFNHRRVIGKGRLGTVYAAAMTKEGELVAVKRIHPHLVLTNAGFGFSSILRWLSLADHPHIVPITGFSEAPGERIIVMEYEGMLSLDFYLHQNPDGAALLDWRRRLRIAVGAARGIEYLHQLVPPIIHGCVKPSNILVDVKFCARLCDYGLHFLAPHEEQGLIGYVDEEYWENKKGGSKECDVFGLGIVLLELLSGRKCEEGLIVEWGFPLIKGNKLSEFLDPRLVIPSDVGPLVRLTNVALACVGNCRISRPSIGQVVAILNSLEMSL